MEFIMTITIKRTIFIALCYFSMQGSLLQAMENPKSLLDLSADKVGEMILNENDRFKKWFEKTYKKKYSVEAIAKLLPEELIHEIVQEILDKKKGEGKDQSCIYDKISPYCVDKTKRIHFQGPEGLPIQSASFSPCGKFIIFHTFYQIFIFDSTNYRCLKAITKSDNYSSVSQIFIPIDNITITINESFDKKLEDETEDKKFSAKRSKKNLRIVNFFKHNNAKPFKIFENFYDAVSSVTFHPKKKNLLITAERWAYIYDLTDFNNAIKQLESLSLSQAVVLYRLLIDQDNLEDDDRKIIMQLPESIHLAVKMMNQKNLENLKQNVIKIYENI